MAIISRHHNCRSVKNAKHNLKTAYNECDFLFCDFDFLKMASMHIMLCRWLHIDEFLMRTIHTFKQFRVAAILCESANRFQRASYVLHVESDNSHFQRSYHHVVAYSFPKRTNNGTHSKNGVDAMTDGWMQRHDTCTQMHQALKATH